MCLFDIILDSNNGSTTEKPGHMIKSSVIESTFENVYVIIYLMVRTWHMDGRGFQSFYTTLGEGEISLTAVQLLQK